MPEKPKLSVLSREAVLRRVLMRQAADQRKYGTFMQQPEKIQHRTDVKRHRSAEDFLADFVANYPSAAMVDIGSGLGNPDPMLRGSTVRSLMRNPRLAGKLRTIATDIPGEILPTEGLDVEEIPSDFSLPLASIINKRGNFPLWVARAANSIDLLMDEAQTRQHLSQVARDAREQELLYLFNKHILYKPRESEEYRLVGELNPEGFQHQSKTWLDTRRGTPYTLEPSPPGQVSTEITSARTAGQKIPWEEPLLSNAPPRVSLHGRTIGPLLSEAGPSVPEPSRHELPYQTYERMSGRRWTGGASDPIRSFLSKAGITDTPGSATANLKLQKYMLQAMRER